MMKVDRWGHLGYLLFFIGNLLIANQNALGYPVTLGAASIWIWLGFRMRMTSIWSWEILTLFTASYGWWYWTRP